ncbi:MAG: threonylcarbamoyl-AMP synthase [Planctomycetaceae bacterium]|nr:threonylcarbamoyl-AMP synthase [Planctomycetaceae bacterium]
MGGVRGSNFRFGQVMNCDIGSDIPRAAAIIRNGGLVGMPTETVYGLAANALDARAVARIFEAKQRPFFDPLIVHVADRHWMPRVVSEFPPLAQRMADRFWPGPLTLVLPRSSGIPDLVTSGLPSVGVRMPRHPLALQLLTQSGLPIAAPSANLFGRISPTTAQHVADQLGDRIDYILDGGSCDVGLESTVLKLDPRPCLLRPGGISLEELEAELGHVDIIPPTDHPSENDSATPQTAPGMLPQHYAPRTPLFLESGISARDSASRPSGRLGGLGFTTVPAGYAYSAQEILSPAGNLVTAAAGFFAALRRLDELSLDAIVAGEFPDQGLGRALNDRLRRAAYR